MIGEIASSERETDKWRMLMHALVLVRLGTLFNISSGTPFVVMAIYVRNDLVVERFLAFKDDNGRV